MPSDVSENNKRLAKNTMYMYIRMGVTMLVSLYTSRVILQNLGVSDYGIYNIVGSVIAAFAFISGPLGTATQRFYNYELGKGNTKQVNVVFNMSLIIYIILSLFLFVIIEIAGIWFIQNKMELPVERMDAAIFAFHMSVITFIFGLIKLPFDALVVANEKMSFYAWISILDVVLRLLNAFSLVFFLFDKLELYTVNLLLITIIGLLFTVIYSLRMFKYIRFCKPKQIWDKPTFNALFSFSGWSLFGSVASMTANQGLNILLNMFYGVIVNAAMGIANQVNTAITQFVSNFQVAFRPQIVKYYAAGQIEELQQLINRTARLSYMLLFGLICPLWFNMQYILEIWLGEGNVPEYAATFSILMMVYALFETLSAPMWMTVQATGSIKKYQIVISIIIFMNIVISYIFLKIGFRPTIVLEIKCCLDLIYLATRLLFMRSMINMSIRGFFYDVLLPLGIISVVSVMVLLLLSYYIDSHLTQLIASVFVFALLYIPLIFRIGLTKNERTVVLTSICNKINR
jgi:O-antigen/teichoic acid export membrane protein